MIVIHRSWCLVEWTTECYFHDSWWHAPCARCLLLVLDYDHCSAGEWQDICMSFLIQLLSNGNALAKSSVNLIM